MTDLHYVTEDHRFRTHDVYAEIKYRISRRWITRHLVSESKLLNVGCGAGDFNNLIQPEHIRVVACEPDPVAFQMAKDKANPDVEILNADLFQVPNQEFDAVVMHDVLEHIDSEGGAIRQVANLLKEGGILVISVPALDILFGSHDEKLGHYRRYSKTSLRRALRKDFEVLHLRYIGFVGLPIVLYYSRLKRVEYPISRVENRRIVMTIFRTILAAERWLPIPVGTSLLCLARKR